MWDGVPGRPRTDGGAEASSPEGSNGLLSPLSQALSAGGVGCIVRVLTARKTV